MIIGMEMGMGYSSRVIISSTESIDLNLKVKEIKKNAIEE